MPVEIEVMMGLFTVTWAMWGWLMKTNGELKKKVDHQDEIITLKLEKLMSDVAYIKGRVLNGQK